MNECHAFGEFEIVSLYALCVRFEDRTEQTINFRPILESELYGPLRDLELSNQVRNDSDAKTLVWPNGADCDPATMHDWPEYVRELRELAVAWAAAQACFGSENVEI